MHMLLPVGVSIVTIKNINNEATVIVPPQWPPQLLLTLTHRPFCPVSIDSALCPWVSYECPRRQTFVCPFHTKLYMFHTGPRNVKL